MNRQYRILTVTKSHWDREWYMNFQKTRVRLLHLIDTVLDLLDDDPDFVSFMLDGQTLPLEDYLDVKPEAFDRLRDAIQSGRLVVGPWYILPDEVLITGETHIRNYLLGSRLARKFGARKMEVGYLPDSFGHPSQMPQIIRGLGMDTIMFWRGATAEIQKNEFRWHAPDGTSVLTVLMPEGYSTGCELANDPDLVARRLDEYIAKMAPRSASDLIYLSNGGDHIEPSRHLSGVLREASRRMRNGTVTHTTLERFLALLKSRLDEEDLEHIRGELWGSHTAILLGSTLSTRTYLKQLNHRANVLLEGELEPLWTMAASLGAKYPRDILVRAWKYLMENQPHDSICGCSIDQVHQDMLFRFNQVFEIGDVLREDLAGFFSGVLPAAQRGDCTVAVFNTGSARWSDVVEVVVDTDQRLTAASDYSRFGENGRFPLRHTDNSEEALRRLPASVRVYDGQREIPAELVRATVENKLDLGYERAPHQYNVNRLVIAFRAEDVPPMGWKIYGVEPVYDQAESRDDPSADVIENEFFRVRALPDGTFELTDLSSGRVFPGLNRLVDGGDCGDEYTYCPPDADALFCADPDSVSHEVVGKNDVRQCLRITGKLALPAAAYRRSEGRSATMVDNAFEVVVTLMSGIRRVDVVTTVDNRSEDHRLRAHFPTGIRAQTHRSSGTFSVDERPMKPEIDPGAQEDLSTFPMKDFCHVGDGGHGFAVACRGLREYEAIERPDGSAELAVTLLRCTGVISQRQMKTRRVKGGWSEKAPGGQCPGIRRFEYSIMPHEGGWDEAGIAVAAHRFCYPMAALALEAEGGNDLSQGSLIDTDDPALIVSALKQCEFEDRYILRLYNTAPRPVDARVRFHCRAGRVIRANLREDDLWEYRLSDGQIELHAEPFEIVTLKFDMQQRR